MLGEERGGVKRIGGLYEDLGKLQEVLCLA